MPHQQALALAPFQNAESLQPADRLASDRARNAILLGQLGLGHEEAAVGQVLALNPLADRASQLVGLGGGSRRSGRCVHLIQPRWVDLTNLTAASSIK